MCCFSVQKEIQRGVLTALPAAGSPVGMSSSKCLFFFYYFFFSLKRKRLQMRKVKQKCWCLLLYRHIDLYQSGSQTCSHA